MKISIATITLFLSLTSVKLLGDNALKTPTPSAIVHEYFADLQSGNFEALMNLFTDDVIWHQPGSNQLSGIYQGKAELGGLFGKFMQISQNSFRIDDVMFIAANGNMVSATLSFSAKKCNYFEVSMKMRGVDVMRIEDGKIKEVFLFSENQEQEDSFWGIRQ